MTLYNIISAYEQQVTECTAMNFSTIVCVAPPLLRIPLHDTDGLNYTLLMDNAPGPDLSLDNLQITVLPNPKNFMLLTTTYAELINGLIQISVWTVFNLYTECYCNCICTQGDNLYSVSVNEIHVTIGGATCVITAVDTNDSLVCTTHLQVA